MKLMISLVLSTLSFAAIAQAGSNQNLSEQGLIECGRHYYKGTVTIVPQTNVFRSAQAELHFENAGAEAACGGEVVSLRTLNQKRGTFLSYKMPRFLSSSSKNRLDASLIDKRSLVKGRVYEIACGSALFDAKVVDLQDQNYGLASLQFADSRAEAVCGGGRYHQMWEILDKTEDLEEALSR